MGSPLVAIAGDDASWALSLLRGGLPYGSLTLANVLVASLWRGDGRQAIVPGLTASFIPAVPITQIRLDAPGTSTLNLAPTTYSAKVEVLVGAGKRPAWYGQIEILGGVGSTPTPTAYCTIDDMEARYPTVTNMLRLDSDGFGFVNQINLARREIDLFLVERYNPAPGYQKRRNATFDPSVGFDVPDNVTVPPTSALIRASLNNDGLVRTPPDDAVVAEIASRLAVSLVLERQPGGNNRFGQDADFQRSMAVNGMRSYRAYIDTNADGIAEVLIGRDCIFLV